MLLPCCVNDLFNDMPHPLFAPPFVPLLLMQFTEPVTETTLQKSMVSALRQLVQVCYCAPLEGVDGWTFRCHCACFAWSRHARKVVIDQDVVITCGQISTATRVALAAFFPTMQSGGCGAFHDPCPPPHTHTPSHPSPIAPLVHTRCNDCAVHMVQSCGGFSHSVDDFSVVLSLVWLLLCVVRVCVRVQVVVGFAGKLVGYLQAGDLYPGVELRFMDCLPVQQSLRRTDIVTLLLQIADIVRGTPPSDVASASGCLSPPPLCLFSLPALPVPPVTSVSVSHGVSLRLLGVADTRM